MDLKTLQDSLEKQNRAPTEKWNPPYCGDIDMEIRADGRWFYMGTPIGREALVRLFASVIRKEQDNYFLVTPAEKIGIKVVDLPFMVTDWHFAGDDSPQLIQVVTNVGETYPLNDQYPLVIHDDLPAVRIRDGMMARVHRNVYYKWAEHLQPALENETPGLYLPSGQHRFWFGSEA